MPAAQHNIEKNAVRCIACGIVLIFYHTAGMTKNVPTGKNKNARRIGRRAQTLALLANVAVLVYMVYKVVKTKRNPYKGELYTGLKCYHEVKELAAEKQPAE